MFTQNATDLQAEEKAHVYRREVRHRVLHLHLLLKGAMALLALVLIVVIIVVITLSDVTRRRVNAASFFPRKWHVTGSAAAEPEHFRAAISVRFCPVGKGLLRLLGRCWGVAVLYVLARMKGSEAL